MTIAVGAAVNTQSVTYFASKAKSNEAAATVLGSGLTLAAALSVVLVPCAWLANFSFLGPQSPAYFSGFMYSLIIPIMLLSAAVMPTFLAVRDAGTYWGLRILNSIVYASGLVGLSLVHGLTVKRCVLLALLGTFVQAAGAFIAYSRRRVFRVTWDAVHVKAMAIYGAKTNVVGLPYHLNARLDQILMSILLPPQALGYYVVAVAWASILSFAGGGVSSMMLAVSSSADTSRAIELELLLSKVRVVFLLLLLAGIIAAVLSPVGVTLLFGESYIGAIWPAVLLCLAGVALNMNLVMHEFLRGLGYPGKGAVAELAALGITGLLLFALLPRYGGLGAAISSLAAYSSSFLVLIIQVSRSMNIPMRQCVAPTLADIARMKSSLLSTVGPRDG